MFDLQRVGALPVAAADEPFLMKPVGVQLIGIDTEESAWVITRFGYGFAGFWIDQWHNARRVGRMAFSIPFGCHRVVDIVPVGPSVIAQMALVGSMVYPALFRAVRDIVFDRQMVDVDLAAYAVLAGMVDHHVLDDLDAFGVCRSYQVLIACIRRFEARVDFCPVVSMITMVIQAGAVFHRRGDPNGGETKVADVIQALDQAFEVAAPVGVYRHALGIELDAVAAKKIIGRVTVVESRGDEEVNGFLAEILAFTDWRKLC